MLFHQTASPSITVVWDWAMRMATEVALFMRLSTAGPVNAMSDFQFPFVDDVYKLLPPAGRESYYLSCGHRLYKLSDRFSHWQYIGQNRKWVWPPGRNTRCPWPINLSKSRPPHDPWKWAWPAGSDPYVGDALYYDLWLSELEILGAQH